MCIVLLCDLKGTGIFFTFQIAAIKAHNRHFNHSELE